MSVETDGREGKSRGSARPKTSGDASFRRKIKILATLLFLFALLLSFAMVSYTPKDQANASVTIGEFLGVFTGDEAAMAAAETTRNWLGLIGAIISNFLYNSTFGFATILLPIFMGIWAYKLFTEQELSNKLVRRTALFAGIAVLFAATVGSMQQIPWLSGIPAEWSGSGGRLIAETAAPIIGVAGSLILFFAGLLASVYFGFNLSYKRIFSGIAGLQGKKPDEVKRSFRNFIDKIKSKFIKPDDKKTHKPKKEKSPEKPIPEPTGKTPEATPESATQTAPAYGKAYGKSSPNDPEPARVIRRGLEITVERPKKSSEEKSVINLNEEKPTNGVDKEERTFKANGSCLLPEDYGRAEIKEEKAPEPESPKSDAPSYKKTEIDPRVVEDLKNDDVADYIKSKNGNAAPETTEATDPVDEELPSKSETLNEKTTEDVDSPDGAEEEVGGISLTREESAAGDAAPPLPEAPGKKLNITVSERNEEPECETGPVNPLSTNIHDEDIRFRQPDISILKEDDEDLDVDDEELKMNARILQEKLETFKINIENLRVTPGPVVTLYEFVPAAGIKISKIEGLADDIAMALKARGIRIIAPIPGKGTVGIEIPNHNPKIVRFSSIIKSPKFYKSDFKLPIAFGKTIVGDVYCADLSKMPHLLIAGATGAGKSVGMNTIIASLLYRMHPSRLKFVLIDPKKVEMAQYNALERHYLASSPDVEDLIITTPSEAVTILNALCAEMDQRYDILSKVGQRNIKDYNKKIADGKLKSDEEYIYKTMPYIVVIIDELADLMMTASKEVEAPITRLAQLARAVGIHLVVATQRPSVDVITGIIKANFPARVAYQVSAKVDSRTILDGSGAEYLLGNGDMLFMPGGASKPVRIQNSFISGDEVEEICEFIRDQKGYSEPYMLPSLESSSGPGAIDIGDRDDLFEEAAKLIISTGQGSTSMIQRRLKVGYARAGRIMDELHEAGIVGPPDGSKPRKVLVESAADLEAII